VSADFYANRRTADPASRFVARLKAEQDAKRARDIARAKRAAEHRAKVAARKRHEREMARMRRAARLKCLNAMVKLARVNRALFSEPERLRLERMLREMKEW
jgi:hypothetical protein